MYTIITWKITYFYAEILKAPTNPHLKNIYLIGGPNDPFKMCLEIVLWYQQKLIIFILKVLKRILDVFLVFCKKIIDLLVFPSQCYWNFRLIQVQN